MDPLSLEISPYLRADQGGVVNDKRISWDLQDVKPCWSASEDIAANPIDPLLSQVVIDSILPWRMAITINDLRAAAQIHDIITQIHHFLRTKPSATDWSAQSSHSQTEISDAFDQRINNYEGLTAGAEQSAGMRRVDYLKGNCQFAGFSVVSPKRWRMNVKRGRGK